MARELQTRLEVKTVESKDHKRKFHEAVETSDSPKVCPESDELFRNFFKPKDFLLKGVLFAWKTFHCAAEFF